MRLGPVLCAIAGLAAAPAPAQEGPVAVDLRAPAVYRVLLETSRGPIVIEVERELAPRGADRFFSLVRSGFYDGARFFRVVPGTVALFGMPADPGTGRAWAEAELEDDPVRTSNARGTIAFANAGPNTRTTQVFLNLRDNPRLDGLGFAPFGRVIQGLEVAGAFYARYGDPGAGTPAPDLRKIREHGNAYLEREFPKLDYILSAELVARDDVIKPFGRAE